MAFTPRPVQNDPTLGLPPPPRAIPMPGRGNMTPGFGPGLPPAYDTGREPPPQQNDLIARIRGLLDPANADALLGGALEKEFRR